MKSKTIILSNENHKGRGILTIYQEENLLQCRIRLYNTPKLDRFCKIGIYHENKVYSANLLEKNNVFTSSIVGDFNINNDFYAALINTNNNNEVILSGGTYAGFFFNDNSVFEDNKLNSIFENTVEKVNPNTNLYKHHEDWCSNEITNSYSQEKIDNNSQTLNLQKSETNQQFQELEKCENKCDKCENCIYKEYFYSHNETTNNNFDNLNNSSKNDNPTPKELYQAETNVTTHPNYENYENIVKTSNQPARDKDLNQSQDNASNETKTILESLIPQFKYVFENYPEDEILNNLIPNGKFVKINENNNQYSIGAIYEDEEMKYICYAVMCNYNSPAPQELGQHYQWLPLDKEDPLSEGYYIVFQDTQDLKIVEL